ncbi:VWA domain-containing protein [Kitasatospora sp. NPDC008050]|uniref:vWA domain-containing protein n=1 Tax=Kitasatospora sp. NPDC008050 TaxID=3364021 RepID=UPI0036EE4B2D
MTGSQQRALPERLTGFVHALRGHQVRVGPGETVDAAAVLAVLGLADRERLREGLAAALLRGQGQRPVFDATFDLYFPGSVGEPSTAGPATTDSVEELREHLAEALAAGDNAAMARLAGRAVQALGQYGASPAQGAAPGAGGWSAHQTLDRLRPQILLARVLAALRAGRPDAPPDALTDRIEPDEIRRRIEAFRGLVATEARRRTAEERGIEEIARRAVAPSVDQIDFLLAGRDQLAELRRSVRPLSRKLATQLAARRRRAARGRIDLRRTVRRSLGTGGVPLRPAYRQRRPQRPELLLLCDVSSSVAGFADFTMLLVQALREEFSRVRVFAFVNRVDEVTHLVTTGTADPGGLARRILAEAAVIGYHPYSDYGSALGEFADRYREAVTPRTSVLILGDARNNRRDPNLPALAQIAKRARRVHWLNPEQPALWSTGDSAALGYAGLVAMQPCRNARQLGELVTRLLPV